MSAPTPLFAFDPEEPVHFDGAGNVTMTLGTFNLFLRAIRAGERAEAALALRDREATEEEVKRMAKVVGSSLSRAWEDGVPDDLVADEVARAVLAAGAKRWK